MAKISTNNGGDGPYKSKKGYSRVAGLMKSEAEKESLEKKQTRLNSFSGAQNKAVGEQQEINTGAKKVPLNDYGAPKGGQEFKTGKKKGKYTFPGAIRPKF